jgi:hypothetical protein
VRSSQDLARDIALAARKRNDWLALKAAAAKTAETMEETIDNPLAEETAMTKAEGNKLEKEKIKL